MRLTHPWPPSRWGPFVNLTADLEEALTMGAERVIQSNQSNIPEALLEWTEGHGVDAATGSVIPRAVPCHLAGTKNP